MTKTKQALDLQVVRKKLSDYRQNDANPVKHSPRNLATIVSSIQQVGAGRSGLASGGELLAGNATWEAMAEAGIEDVIEITTSGHEWLIVNRPDLTEEQKRFAAHADQRSAMLADIDTDVLKLDLDAGVDLSSLYREDEIDNLLKDVAATEDSAEQDTGEDTEEVSVVRSDVPDALWPTDNDWGIPVLDMHLQADAVDLPVMRWSSVQISRMRGTCHYYTADAKFSALWNDPSSMVNTKCINVVEPNWSTANFMPRAIMLWNVYRKRWLARYWQSKGFRIFVDLSVVPECAELNMLGVPQGWRAYATRLYKDRIDEAMQEYRIACERAGSDDLLFFAYGGGDACRKLAGEHDWVWIPEETRILRGEYDMPEVVGR